MNTMAEKCFACGKPIRTTPNIVQVVGEETKVFVGPDCYRKIVRAGEYQPPRGGPQLKLPEGRTGET